MNMRQGHHGSARAAALAAVVLVALVLLGWMGGLFQQEPADERAAVPMADLPSEAEMQVRGDSPDTAPEPEEPAGFTFVEGLGSDIRGTVVLPSGAPAAGVSVHVRAGDQGEQVRSDAAGRYNARLILPENADVAWLSARGSDGAGHVGFVVRSVWGTQETWQLPVMVLRATSPLRVQVTRRGKPAADATVLVLGGSETTAAPLERAPCDAKGQAVFAHVPGTEVYVMASAPGAGRGARVVTLPAREPVVLALEDEYVMDVQVVTKGDRDPIVGAIVSVREKMPHGHLRLPVYQLPKIAPTDKDGHTRVRGLPEATPLEIRAAAEGLPTSRWRAMPHLIEAHVIELVPLTEIVFDVRDGGAGIPPDGSAIAITPWVFPTNKFEAAGRMERGRLIVRAANMGSFLSGIATAPDGSSARLQRPTYAIAFSKPARVEVQLQYPDGAPASGLWVKLQRGRQNVHFLPRATGADGEVSFHWPTEAHEVTALLLEGASDDPWARGTRKLGSTMLQQGLTRIEATLPWRREVELRVTTDGARKLPTAYTVQVAGQPRFDVREDRDRGTLRFDWRPPEGEAELVLLSPGYNPAQVMLPTTPTREALTLDVALVRGSSLIVRAHQPADRFMTLEIQRFDREKRGWVTHPIASSGYPRPDLGGRYRFDGMPPGRYRVIDPTSNAGSQEVEVEDAGEVQVTLDSSKSAYVKGVVRVPDGYDVGKAEVAVTGGMRTGGFAPTLGNRSVRVAKNGSFRIRVPGNVEVLLRAVHPELVDDPSRGVRMTAPRSGFELRLEAGARAGIPLAPWPSAIQQHTWMPIEVLLFSGAIDGEPISRHRAVAYKPELRFGGFAPGRYTIWVNAGGFTWRHQDDIAPFVLTGAVLGDGTTTLDPVKTSIGGGVRVTLRFDDPESTRNVRVSAQFEGNPAYRRTVSSRRRGKHPILVNGLGAGRFMVHVDVDNGTIRKQQAVESDGTNVEDITIDLRTR